MASDLEARSRIAGLHGPCGLGDSVYLGTIANRPRPYVVQGTVLLGEQGKLHGFRLSDGREPWTEEVGGVICGVGNDQSTLYVGTLKGVIFAYPSAIH